MNIALLLHLPYKVQISEIIIQFMFLVRFVLFIKFYVHIHCYIIFVVLEQILGLLPHRIA
jgi:hypothetical protein